NFFQRFAFCLFYCTRFFLSLCCFFLCHENLRRRLFFRRLTEWSTAKPLPTSESTLPESLQEPQLQELLPLLLATLLVLLEQHLVVDQALAPPVGQQGSCFVHFAFQVAALPELAVALQASSNHIADGHQDSAFEAILPSPFFLDCAKFFF